jgi:hypothetical protein
MARVRLQAGRDHASKNRRSRAGGSLPDKRWSRRQGRHRLRAVAYAGGGTQFGDAVTQERSAPTFVLFTPKEAATRLKVSESFLAKARMRGDGPPYIMIGRSIRYSEAALIQWMRSQQRLSTSE